MSITCQICNTTFKKIIPWQHLKTHNITSKEYTEKYGPLYSAETLELLKQRIPHNKGKKVTDQAHLEKLRAAISKREERFKNGEIKRGSPRTIDQKKVLSQKQIEYASAHPEEMKFRAQKAIATKIKNHYDFGHSMRGKKHSYETKEKLRISSKITNQKKSNDANSRILERLSSINLTLMNDVSEWSMQLKCQKCSAEFSFIKSYFHLSKFKETLCPTCYPRLRTKQSKGETELYEFVRSLCPDATSGYRKKYHNKEIDIFVPSKNIGFEYNGLYWHSEEVLLHNNKSEKSDFEKQKQFLEEGIQLIQIYEDEWLYQQQIVKSRIANILGKTQTKLFARRCILQEISSKDAASFCNEHHIMGAGRSNVRYGLFHDRELVSVMTFTKSNLSRKLQGWELNRFASKSNVVVIGGASKLFSAFVKKHSPESVISYSDNRWSTGNLYQKLGFIKQHSGTPNYWYVAPGVIKRIHRFALRKSVNNPLMLPEKEIRKQQGYLRIWDCGSSKWVWSK